MLAGERDWRVGATGAETLTLREYALSAVSVSPLTVVAVARSECVPVLARLVDHVKATDCVAPAARVTVRATETVPARPPVGGASVRRTVNVSDCVPWFATV